MKTSGGTYDPMVRDKTLLPKPLSARYVRDIKKLLGRGTKVDVVKSESTMPRGWDFGNYTVLAITPPGRPTVKAAISLLVAEGEDRQAGGNIAMDAPYPTVTVPRRATADEFIKRLLGEMASVLGAREKVRVIRSIKELQALGPIK